MLALVPNLVKRDLKMPVHLAFSYDEECGCSGVMPLVEHVAAPACEAMALPDRGSQRQHES